MRISKWLSTKKSLDCYTNSPCLCLRKCFENSVENMHTDVRDLRVINLRSGVPFKVVRSITIKLIIWIQFPFKIVSRTRLNVTFETYIVHNNPQGCIDNLSNLGIFTDIFCNLKLMALQGFPRSTSNVFNKITYLRPLQHRLKKK